jgi:hypothetical protein
MDGHWQSDRDLFIRRFYFLSHLLGSMALIATVIGCSQPVTLQPGEPVILEVPPEKLWQICSSELKNRGFTLNRVDHRSGQILTDPLTSRQWFEFWCQDVVTSEDILEASLHTLRRTIYLEIQPLEKGRFSLNCKAKVEKMSIERGIVGGQVRTQVFGAAGRMPLLTGPESPNEPQPRWIPLGRDFALEIDILQSIQQTAVENHS